MLVMLLVKRLRLELGFLSGKGIGWDEEGPAPESPIEGETGDSDVASSLSSPSVMLPKMSLLTS